jgi:hypothetical protein
MSYAPSRGSAMNTFLCERHRWREGQQERHEHEPESSGLRRTRK